MNFDLVAPHYDWMEAVTAGGLLQRVRTTWLEELAGRRRVLSVGEGHGKFAGAFVRRYPRAELTCVEPSARMLARAQRRVGANTVQWVHAAVPNWRPPGGCFDGIATCFFLDCFPREELREVIAAIAGGAASSATWLVVDFSVPERGVARWRALAMHAVMYGFFRVATRLPAQRLTPPDEFLTAHGFQLARRREFSWGLLRADVWRRAVKK